VGEDVGHYLFVDGSESGKSARRRVAADAVTFFRHQLSQAAGGSDRGR
jgi:hypothetical protein